MQNRKFNEAMSSNYTCDDEVQDSASEDGTNDGNADGNLGIGKIYREGGPQGAIKKIMHSLRTCFFVQKIECIGRHFT